MVRGVAAALAVLALTACTGAEDDPPAALPSLTSTATPSATVPPLPPEAQGDDAVAAAEFAKYYLQLVESAYERADAGALRSLTDPGCEGCNILIGEVERLAAEGNMYRGGQYEIESAVAPGNNVPDYVVNIVYSRPAGQIVKTSSGEVVAEDPAVARADLQMRVVQRETQWKVFGLRTVS